MLQVQTCRMPLSSRVWMVNAGRSFTFTRFPWPSSASRVVSGSMVPQGAVDVVEHLLRAPFRLVGRLDDLAVLVECGPSLLRSAPRVVVPVVSHGGAGCPARGAWS